MKRYSIIKKEKDFKQIFQRGKKINNPYFTIIYLKNDNDPINRLAFIAPKKHFKKACQRNLIKRRLKAIFNQINFKITGINLIIVAKNSLLEKNFEEIKNILENSLSNEQLI